MKQVVMTLTAVLLACGVAFGQNEPGPNYEHLKCYDQLIGNWVYDGPLQEDSPNLGPKDTKMVVRFSREWVLNKNAVEMNWSIELQGETATSGKSLIGWDTAEQKVIGGGMDSRGGHGLSTATYDEATKTWTIESQGVDPQGRATSSTIVNRLVDKDTFEWQSKNRTGGDVTGDSPVYTFKRVAVKQRVPQAKRPRARRNPQAVKQSSPSKQAPPIK